MPNPIKLGRKERMTFAKINEVAEMPNLIQIQTDSYEDVYKRQVSVIVWDSAWLWRKHRRSRCLHVRNI